MTLRPNVRLQTIAGWEVTADLGVPSQPDPELYAEIVDRAVNEVGITRLRLEVRSGMEQPDSGFRAYADGSITNDEWRPVRYVTINDNDDPYTINEAGFDFSELDHNVQAAVLPVKRALEARGQTLFLNICYVAFIRQAGPGLEYVHDDPEEYAEFVLAAHRYLDETYGLRPDTWEVILEPDTDDASQNWDGRQIGRLIAAAGRRLDEAGYATRFIAPSTTNMANAPHYFDGILDTPGAVERIAELSYHRYSGVSGDAFRAITARKREHGIQTSMLELWFGWGDYNVLHQDLEEGQVSAWQGRVLRGLFDVVTDADGRERTELREDMHFNRQYFYYVRPGAVRIDAAVSRDPFSGPFDPLAFVNPDGGYVVVANAEHAGALSVAGLPPGRYR
ncbi:MAG: hypothetical protein GWO02_17785, partial [Gammaproteobacteria bacterium]|nr:hypothetical protein [Gammaproteobacteria bacterium]